METLKTNNVINNSAKNFIISALLASILSLWVSSCWKTTQNDINNKKYDIEVLSFNISNYINARKKLVNEYNTILAYPKTESNKYEIDAHLCLLEEQIHSYDEKIKDLVEEKLKVQVDLTEIMKDRWTTWVHSSIDPNKWDYLLAVQ